MDKNLNLEPRRTTWGAAVQTSAYTRTPIKYVPETTLNEKFSIAEEVEINPRTDFPYINYYGYGRGSTYMKVLPGDGSSEAVNYLHEPVDAALFYQMPFILRTLDNDIPASKRSQFAIRALIEVGGIIYIGYWLHELERTESEVVSYKVTPATADTPERKDELVGDPAYLNPTTKASGVGLERTDGAYTRIQVVLQSRIDAWLIDEMINAKQILTGNNQLEMTELGLFSAIPQNYTSNIGGVSVTYREAIKAQLNLISPQRVMLNNYVGAELIIQHDLGVDDPTNFNYVS